MLGLKRGTVKLCPHEKDWEIQAENTIRRLKSILGEVITGIEHVGSTSISSIKAKPIIDIALAVNDFKDILAFEEELKRNGFYYRPNAEASLTGQMLFACGSYYDGTGDIQTHFIHVVRTGSRQWANYINFRDYLRSHPSAAREYESLKLSLEYANAGCGDREKYTNGKHEFITYTLRKATAASYLGKEVKIQIDRPMGSRHPLYRDRVYPVNYGFIPGVMGGDNEDMDVYLLGVNTPVKEYKCRIIGIVHRSDDTEDKLIAAPAGMEFGREEMAAAVAFQEQYFKSIIEAIPEES